MLIKFRAYGVGIPTDINGEYELDEGTTASEAVLKIMKNNDALEKSDALPDSLITINRKRVDPGVTLHDGDVLSVIRTLSGG